MSTKFSMVDLDLCKGSLHGYNIPCKLVGNCIYTDNCVASYLPYALVLLNHDIRAYVHVCLVCNNLCMQRCKIKFYKCLVFFNILYMYIEKMMERFRINLDKIKFDDIGGYS